MCARKSSFAVLEIVRFALKSEVASGSTNPVDDSGRRSRVRAPSMSAGKDAIGGLRATSCAGATARWNSRSVVRPNIR